MPTGILQPSCVCLQSQGISPLQWGEATTACHDNRTAVSAGRRRVGGEKGSKILRPEELRPLKGSHAVEALDGGCKYEAGWEKCGNGKSTQRVRKRRGEPRQTGAIMEKVLRPGLASTRHITGAAIMEYSCCSRRPQHLPSPCQGPSRMLLVPPPSVYNKGGGQPLPFFLPTPPPVPWLRSGSRTGRLGCARFHAWLRLGSGLPPTHALTAFGITTCPPSTSSWNRGCGCPPAFLCEDPWLRPFQFAPGSRFALSGPAGEGRR